MLLKHKGPIQPAPKLSGPAAGVAEAIATWPGVIAATHWHLSRSNEIDGVDFYVAEEELGHIHLDGEVHLATSIDLRSILLNAGFARPFPWYKDWIETSIKTSADAEHALWLFEINYRRLRGDALIDLEKNIRSKSDRS